MCSYTKAQDRLYVGDEYMQLDSLEYYVDIIYEGLIPTVDNNGMLNNDIYFEFNEYATDLQRATLAYHLRLTQLEDKTEELNDKIDKLYDLINELIEIKSKKRRK